MSPRTGRPTENPKRNYTGIRLSNDELDKLKFCMDKTGLSKTNIIRKGIDLVYNELTKK
jgi:predicted DNA-binding protein